MIKPGKSRTVSQTEFLRNKRETECFPIINRGKLWYDMLTHEQYCELMKWYIAWLDVTKTKIVPELPTWVNNKLEPEEIL